MGGRCHRHLVHAWLAVAASVALGACAPGAPSTTSGPAGSAGAATAAATAAAATNAASESPQALETLQFVNPLPTEPVWKQVSECIGAEAAANGIAYTESGPPVSKPGDPAVMIQQVQDATARGVDAIITFPASGAFGPVLQKAQEAGVLTGLLYGDGTPESGATVTAGVDWAHVGQQYVEAMVALPGEHNVGLVAEGPTGIGKSWTDGVTNASADTTANIVGTVYIGADPAKALPQVTSLLTAHPEIDLIASNTGYMTAGAVAAIKSMGLEDKVHLLAINNANGGPEAIRDGIAVGLYLQDLCDLGTRTVRGLVQAARGEDVPLVEVSTVFANKDNLQEYLDKGWN